MTMMSIVFVMSITDLYNISMINCSGMADYRRLKPQEKKIADVTVTGTFDTNFEVTLVAADCWNDLPLVSFEHTTVSMVKKM